MIVFATKEHKDLKEILSVLRVEIAPNPEARVSVFRLIRADPRDPWSISSA